MIIDLEEGWGELIQVEALGRGAYSRGDAWEGRLFERRPLAVALVRGELGPVGPGGDNSGFTVTTVF